ncbi:Uncharacterized protein ACO02O_06097 [Dirofilaria immitis]
MVIVEMVSWLGKCFIILTINSFHVVHLQQLTPIIGGKCDINTPDVPIGGKETQFFLKCERSLQLYVLRIQRVDENWIH